MVSLMLSKDVPMALTHLYRLEYWGWRIMAYELFSTVSVRA